MPNTYSRTRKSARKKKNSRKKKDVKSPGNLVLSDSEMEDKTPDKRIVVTMIRATQSLLKSRRKLKASAADHYKKRSISVGASQKKLIVTNCEDIPRCICFFLGCALRIVIYQTDHNGHQREDKS